VLSKYNNFIENKLLESIIQESIIYFTPPLRKILKGIESDISKDLLDSEATNVKPDITFVDFDKDDYLTFSTMRNIKKLILQYHPHLEYIDERPNIHIINSIWDAQISNFVAPVFKKSRSQIKIGRLINRLFPGKYSDKEIENFINQFKAIQEKMGEKFQIVEGEEIEFWYNSKNYKSESGTLGSSCMRNSIGIFEIYVKNPEVCRMLILTEDDKLIGRALIWKPKYIGKLTTKTDLKCEYFLDRQYGINDSTITKMRNYAAENDWAYKAHNNHHSYRPIIYKGEEFNAKIEVEVENIRYSQFPYLDTLRRYDPNTHTLYNDDEQEEGCYILDSTSGGYTEVESGVWSSYYDENIPEEDAIYSDHLDTYIWTDRAVEVRAGNRRYRGWYPEDYDDIVWSDYEDSHLYIDDSNWSEKYGDYISISNSISIIYKISDDLKVNGDEFIVADNDKNTQELDDFEDYLWHERACEIDSDWKHGHSHTGIDKSLLTINYRGEPVPIKMTTTVYNTSNDIYLTEIDSQILGLKADKNDSRIIDNFEYHTSLHEEYKLIDTLKTKLKEEIEELKNKDDRDDDYYESLSKIYSDRLKEVEGDKWYWI
jgi:hypothetical protein